MKKSLFIINVMLGIVLIPQTALAGNGQSSGGTYVHSSPELESGTVIYKQGEDIVFKGYIDGGVREHGSWICGLTSVSTVASELYSSMGIVGSKFSYKGVVEVSGWDITAALDTSDVPAGQSYRFYFMHT